MAPTPLSTAGYEQVTVRGAGLGPLDRLRFEIDGEPIDRSQLVGGGGAASAPLNGTAIVLETRPGTGATHNLVAIQLACTWDDPRGCERALASTNHRLVQRSAPFPFA